jgi:hypothetical protein
VRWRRESVEHEGVSQITVLMQVFATSQVAFMPGL